MNPLSFVKYYPFYLRKKIKDKIIVIESDDWGLERALNYDAIKILNKKYGNNNITRWTTDGLETKEDLNLLFEVLNKYKKDFSHPPIITANFITHNIDYNSDTELKFIPIDKGFNSQFEDVREIYKKAIEEGLMYPQLHGYSHYNFTELNSYFKTKQAQQDFKAGFALGKTTYNPHTHFLGFECSLSNQNWSEQFSQSMNVFINLFGFSSNTFIPPRFGLDKPLIKLMVEKGIKMLQAGNRLVNTPGKRLKYPYLRKISGMRWSVRNARLDPFPDYNFDYGSCLNQIKDAFNKNLPAVIDFHRVNFAGIYNKSYRENTLSELDLLFANIKKKWPETEFITTPELLEKINAH